MYGTERPKHTQSLKHLLSTQFSYQLFYLHCSVINSVSSSLW